MTKNKVDTCGQCDGCAYDRADIDGCAAFTERPEGCKNFTTQKQSEERERQIANYAGCWIDNQGRKLYGR